MKKLYFVLFFVFASLFFNPFFASARNVADITDWYIQNNKTTIILNKADSSALVTEEITADCGNLFNKHGIYRVVSYVTETNKGRIVNKIELVSITDFSGNNYKYLESYSNNSVIWKIGDPNKIVTGVNNYKIVYKVLDVVRFFDPNFDEFYWNIMGNFWDIETDKFSADIIFPAEATNQNAVVSYYTGYLGEKSTDLATYSWTTSNILHFESTKSLDIRQGITASVAFPKNIFIPRPPTFLEKYGEQLMNLFFLIPILVFIIAFLIWFRYGKDPKIKKPIPPEFGIPENITPMQMGMVMNSGRFSGKLITATIIDLAVKKYVTIEKQSNKILFLNLEGYKFTKAENYKNKDSLSEPEKDILDVIFGKGRESVTTNELRSDLPYQVKSIASSALKNVENLGWLEKGRIKTRNLFFALGVLSLMPTFVSIVAGYGMAEMSFWENKTFFSLLVSTILLFVFGFLMTKRTQKGADLMFKILGFERYMKQAEDYRQQFYEKENIFDKFLPYAMVFGITELWIKKMETIYGPDFYKTHQSAWLVGATAGSLNSHSMDSFMSSMNSLTHQISSSSSSSSSSSGFGGGGSSGGGGGGGGGGW